MFTQVQALSMEVIYPTSCLIDLDEYSYSSISIKQEIGYYLHREGLNLGKHRVPCLLLPLILRSTAWDPLPEIRQF